MAVQLPPAARGQGSASAAHPRLGSASPPWPWAGLGQASAPLRLNVDVGSPWELGGQWQSPQDSQGSPKGHCLCGSCYQRLPLSPRHGQGQVLSGGLGASPLLPPPSPATRGPFCLSPLATGAGTPPALEAVSLSGPRRSRVPSAGSLLRQPWGLRLCRAAPGGGGSAEGRSDPSAPHPHQATWRWTDSALDAFGGCPGSATQAVTPPPFPSWKLASLPQAQRASLLPSVQEAEGTGWTGLPGEERAWAAAEVVSLELSGEEGGRTPVGRSGGPTLKAKCRNRAESCSASWPQPGCSCSVSLSQW